MPTPPPARHRGARRRTPHARPELDRTRRAPADEPRPSEPPIRRLVGGIPPHLHAHRPCAAQEKWELLAVHTG